jgi:glutamate synthase domain-containing protein 2
LKRFKTGAMSYGSISKESHEALAIAMNRFSQVVLKTAPGQYAIPRRRAKYIADVIRTFVY